jgi:excisionase family DNA binding protein
MHTERVRTVRDVAEQFAVHPATIRRWIRAGKLDAVKVQHSVRVRQSSVDRVLLESAVASATH